MPVLRTAGDILLLLTTSSESSSSQFGASAAALSFIMVASWIMLMTAIPRQHAVGVTGLSVISGVVVILP